MIMVGKEPSDVRNKMLEGPGGLLKNTAFEVDYRPTQRKIIWPNGSECEICSGANPEQSRGFSGDTAWLDEIAAWKNPDAVWENLTMGMREASDDRPRICITTTPKPIPLIKRLAELSETEPDNYVLVQGSSYENTALDDVYFDVVLQQYEGTTLGRQEIYAEILNQSEGALWTRDLLDRVRIEEDKNIPSLDDYDRIGIGVDPQGTTGKRGGATGIIAVGVIGHRCYVLADHSMSGTPDEWARAVVGAYHAHNADIIIAEKNHGGDMVESTIRVVDPTANVRTVWASHGKTPRAEPVQALYEAQRVYHLDYFPDLEDEMCEWVPGDRSLPSPNRLDAMVWAISKLALNAKEPLDVGPLINDFCSSSYWRFAG